MPANDHSAAIEQELTQALDELASALARAGEATAAIRSIVPRFAAAGAVLAEIEALVRSGPSQIVPSPETAGSPQAYTRPTLVPADPVAPRPRPVARRKPDAPSVEVVAPLSEEALPAKPLPRLDGANATASPTPFPDQAGQPGVTCFRLEFESKAGPLDLRAVDGAVSEHPAVRDVALLDYDGRHATLKVWIDSTSTPADVQSALKARAAEVFPAAHDISIIALEDVA